MRPISKLPSGRSLVAFGWCAAAASLAIAAAIAVTPAAQAQSGADAVYAVTYLDVGTNAVSQGVELIKKYRELSRREAANSEFTVLQEASRPNRFVIMEGWKDQAAFEAHDKGTAKAEFEGALKPIRNSPPDRHMLQPFANAPARPVPGSGTLYMVEHVDFLGGDPAIAAAAAPLVKALADSSQKEAGAVRYEIYRQPPPRINHYEIVAAWTDAKAFDAHETAAHTLQFRAATANGGRAWRANLYDQRRYKEIQ
ncbi:MAG TPA: antibiotic biosynthesis monooxygenase [Xanthobacteraceae bacterium]|jgi:quinol monooxygenase YgiN|nr:antibiotic biosynthesis monooxygenase [Xanthobacteraceae bacterium]